MEHLHIAGRPVLSVQATLDGTRFEVGEFADGAIKVRVFVKPYDRPFADGMCLFDGEDVPDELWGRLPMLVTITTDADFAARYDRLS